MAIGFLAVEKFSFAGESVSHPGVPLAAPAE
jgi:hypothetical protein